MILVCDFLVKLILGVGFFSDFGRLLVGMLLGLIEVVWVLFGLFKLLLGCCGWLVV